MEVISQVKPAAHTRRRIGIVLAAILLVALAVSIRPWRDQDTADKPKSPDAKSLDAVQVVSALVAQADLPVRLTANGTVSAVQTVEVRPQISAAIKAVHIKEGQFVRKGDRLFTLDTRTEGANLGKVEAQVARDRTDLSNAERNLERQRALFRQEYISQAEFDAAQNQVDSLRGQLAVDLAIVEASRVTHGFGEITAPIAGRTGAIAVYPGSLVQPNGAALMSITQIDPINISFTLPERELAALQQALAQGEVPVSAKLDLPGQQALKGRLVFVDNAVDTASGTIRLKASFHNPGHILWPGMFVTVALAPRILNGVVTVPVQAVQTGPENKFIYVIGENRKVTIQPVTIRLIQDDLAVVEGIAPGTCIVVEGAQNLRPDSVVQTEDGRQQTGSSAPHPKSPSLRSSPTQAGEGANEPLRGFGAGKQ